MRKGSLPTATYLCRDKKKYLEMHKLIASFYSQQHRMHSEPNNGSKSSNLYEIVCC